MKTYQHTICGNSGVNIQCVNPNHSVADNMPTKAPTVTCLILWYNKYTRPIDTAIAPQTTPLITLATHTRDKIELLFI